MKRTILVLLLVSAAANKLQAQGTVYLNNYDSRAGIYAGYPSVPAPAGFAFVEVLAGPSPSSWVPLLNSSGQGPVFTIEAAGVNALGPDTGSYFNVGYAAVPGVPPGAPAFFGLFGWMGASSWDMAVDRASVVWSQTAGTTASPAHLMIPGPLELFVPEPSPAALAGLAMAIFGFRRWHKRSR